MPETPQNHEQSEQSQTPEKREEQLLAKESQKYRDSAQNMKPDEFKFSFKLETQSEFLKSLMPALEKGINERMQKAAKNAVISQSKFDSQIRDLIEKNIVLGDGIKIPIAGEKGSIFLGEVGKDYAVGIGTKKLSLRASIADSFDGITNVNLVFNPGENSEATAGYDLENKSINATWAQKFSNKNIDGSLGVRAFHEQERGNTGAMAVVNFSF